MKNCPFCGADIEDSARFCLYCMQPLTEKEQIQFHKKKKPQWLMIIAAIVAIFLILAVVWFSRLPAQKPKLPSDDPLPSSATASTQTESSDTQSATEQPHIHSYTIENTAAEYLKEPATCTTPAIYYYSCLCGEKGNGTFSFGALAEHIVVTDPGYPADCVKTGLTDGTHCSVCNIVFFAQTPTPVVSHTFDDDQDATCNVCNYVRVLNCSHAETVKLPAVSPTCIASGLTEGKTCALCEEILTAQSTIAPLGHREVTDQAIASTCTTDGKTEGRHCSVCNTVTVAQVTVTAKGHTEVIDQAVAPTCTTTGLTEGKHCSLCKIILVYQQTLPATDHAFSTEDPLAPCSRCGAQPPHTHNYSEEITASEYLKSEATCLSPAIYYYSCACGEKGSKTFTYGGCGAHNFVDVPGYPAGCTTPGLSDGRQCTVCKDGYDPVVLPAYGHAFSFGDPDPTCVACGEKGTLVIESPTFPVIIDNTYRIDGGTYAVQERPDGNWDITFIFHYTNISSNIAYLCPDVSLRGDFNIQAPCSYTALQPNESGTFMAECYIKDLNGTYRVVFN